MIDLHTHSLFSDGVLVPAELAQRARAKGVTAIAITDHVDHSNVGIVVPALAGFCREMADADITIIPGMEITHVPPAKIAGLVALGRKLGAALIVVHGETVVEPVPTGTNRAALVAGIDVLAHPGLLSAEDAALAAKNGVCLEITARKGHSLSNGRVAALASAAGADMVLDTDAHEPGDLIDDAFARVVAVGAGLSPADFDRMQQNSRRLVDRALARMKGKKK